MLVNTAAAVWQHFGLKQNDNIIVYSKYSGTAFVILTGLSREGWGLKP